MVCSIKANPAERQGDTGDQAEEMIQQMAAMMEEDKRALVDSFIKLETEDEVGEYVAMMQGMRDSPAQDKRAETLVEELQAVGSAKRTDNSDRKTRGCKSGGWCLFCWNVSDIYYIGSIGFKQSLVKSKQVSFQIFKSTSSVY